MQIYDILTTEDYELNGEKRTAFANVGTVFKQKADSGFNLTIRPGFAISGRVLMLPYSQERWLARLRAKDKTV